MTRRLMEGEAPGADERLKITSVQSAHAPTSDSVAAAELALRNAMRLFTCEELMDESLALALPCIHQDARRSRGELAGVLSIAMETLA